MKATPLTKTLAELRSRRWFVGDGMRPFSHRQRIQQMGLRRSDVLERPIVAIINTWSEIGRAHV